MGAPVVRCSSFDMALRAAFPCLRAATARRSLLAGSSVSHPSRSYSNYSGPTHFRENADVVKIAKNSFVELEGTNYQDSSLRLSDRLLTKVTRGLLDEIDLLVCDMAGTVVQEGGLVYKVLRESMIEDGIEVPLEEMHAWHGAKKEAVIAHFASKSGTPDHEIEERVAKVGEIFLNTIDEAYFSEASPIEHIDLSLTHFISGLQKAGCKVGFDTGYPPEIQLGLLEKLKLKDVVDGYISSYQVAAGRPYPYMIYNLMEQCDIMDVSRVAKAGDSVRDIEEGRNAGCGLVIGVLSGADSEDKLMDAGADIVVPVITDLPIPTAKRQQRDVRRIDLS